MSGATGATGMGCSNEKNQIKLDLLQIGQFENQPLATFGPLNDNSCIILKLPKNETVTLLSDSYYLELKKLQSGISSQTYHIIIGVLGVLLFLFIVLSIVGFVKGSK